MKWTYTLLEQLDICVFFSLFFYLIAAFSCVALPGPLSLLLYLRGGGKDSGIRYGQNLGKERRIINGMHQLYHQIPALGAQTIDYLSIICNRHINKDAVSPVDVSLWCPCCC
jgi:hypothetical protein